MINYYILILATYLSKTINREAVLSQPLFCTFWFLLLQNKLM